MFQKPLENQPKNAEKIFKKSSKPNGTALSPLYVVDILLGEWQENTGEFLTVSQILAKLYERHTVYYKPDTIRRVIANIAKRCKNIQLTKKRVRAGDSRAWAFSLSFKK